MAGIAVGAFAVRAAMLPATQCRVSDTQYDALKLEVVLSDAERHFGCAGKRAYRKDLASDLFEEVYRWRGSCQPYHRVSLTLYNDMVHVKSQEKLCLSLSWPRWGSG